jgi:hypothetical protein
MDLRLLEAVGLAWEMGPYRSGPASRSAAATILAISRSSTVSLR